MFNKVYVLYLIQANTFIYEKKWYFDTPFKTYPYDFSIVTKWTKDYPGSPVEPSMSKRGPAEWDGHWVGKSHWKTKLAFQRTGTVSVFPLLVRTQFSSKRYMYYIFAAIKKYPLQEILQFIYVRKIQFIDNFVLCFRTLLFRKQWQIQLRGKKLNIYPPV